MDQRRMEGFLDSPLQLDDRPRGGGVLRHRALPAPGGAGGAGVQLAFGGLDFLAGQVLGKTWMVLLSLPLVSWLRRRDERLGIQPA
jgi:hypothetical protein